MNLFSLTLSLDEDQLSISDYELNGFDIIQYWNRDEGYTDKISEIKMFADFSKFKDSDLVGNPLSLLIVSSKAKDLLSGEVESQLSFHAVSIIDKVNEVERTFYLMTPKRTIDCLNKSKSLMIDEETIVTPVLKGNSIVKEVSIFSLKDHPEFIFIDEKLCQMISDGGLTGFDFTPVVVN